MILFWERLLAALLAVVGIICPENLKGSAIAEGKRRWNTTAGTPVAISRPGAGSLSRFETGHGDADHYLGCINRQRTGRTTSLTPAPQAGCAAGGIPRTHRG